MLRSYYISKWSLTNQSTKDRTECWQHQQYLYMFFNNNKKFTTKNQTTKWLCWLIIRLGLIVKATDSFVDNKKDLQLPFHALSFLILLLELNKQHKIKHFSSNIFIHSNSSSWPVSDILQNAWAWQHIFFNDALFKRGFLRQWTREVKDFMKSPFWPLRVLNNTLFYTVSGIFNLFCSKTSGLYLEVNDPDLACMCSWEGGMEHVWIKVILLEESYCFSSTAFRCF